MTATSETADVWDITVPGVECFSLSNGAVVHNSSDAARYAALVVQQAQLITKKPEPAKKPDLKPRWSADLFSEDFERVGR